REHSKPFQGALPCPTKSILVYRPSNVNPVLFACGSLPEISPVSLTLISPSTRTRLAIGRRKSGAGFIISGRGKTLTAPCRSTSNRRKTCTPAVLPPCTGSPQGEGSRQHVPE